MEHVNKAHLSRVHIPCPVAGLYCVLTSLHTLTKLLMIVGCQVLELLDRVYVHFQNDHGSDSDMVLAPQAFPFLPVPDTAPLPPLPCGPVPMYTISPLMILPGRRKNAATDYALVPSSNESEQHLTFWSCFEFRELLDAQEERSMKEHDLDFEPLRHPASLSIKEPWPEFTILAEPVVAPYTNLVSSPPIGIGTYSSPSQPDGVASRSFLYHAFKRYLENRSSWCPDLPILHDLKPITFYLTTPIETWSSNIDLHVASLGILAS